MDLGGGAKKVGTHVAMHKLVRAIPLIGLVLTVFFAARTIRRKGLRRGGVDVALDLTPGVGRAKALYEAFQGDLIPPKPRATT